MDAKPISISEVIAGQKYYVIPVFQRYYEWPIERWKSLWQDLEPLIDEYDTNLSHFIGPMVIISKAVPYDVPRYLVIDGQQRLMTTFVLLAALRDRARALGYENIARAIDTNDLAFLNLHGERTHKIIPRMRDRDTLFNILRGKLTEVNRDSLLAQAYDYFYSEIERITPYQMNLFENLRTDQIIDRLYNAITQRLRIVMITLGNDDNPSSIYESLNFKHETLADAALIRNYVFMKIDSVDEQEKFDETIWKTFEGMFGTREESQQILTDFYYRYLISETEYIARKRLYSMFTEYVDNFLKEGKSLLQLVNRLKRFAGFFIAITRQCEDPELESAFQRFRALDVDTAIPLLLHLYDRYKNPDNSESITKNNFLTMLNVIESFILRRSILRERTRGYGLDFAVAQSQSKTIRTLMNYFAGKGWPTDQQILEVIDTFAFYLRESKKARLVLTEIERSYGHKERIDFSNLTIEHVMPQQLTLEWRQMLGADSSDVYADYLHTLGNLTLTAYNNEMGNRPYPEKQQVYISSNLQLNKYFSSKNKWTIKEIKERSQVLAKRFLELWPRPEQLMTRKGGGQARRIQPGPISLQHSLIDIDQ